MNRLYLADPDPFHSSILRSILYWLVGYGGNADKWITDFALFPTFPPSSPLNPHYLHHFCALPFSPLRAYPQKMPITEQ